MIPTALISHPDCLMHQPPAGHPESAQRLERILDALAPESMPGLIRLEAQKCSIEDLTRFHPRELVEGIMKLEPQAGRHCYQLDPDTYLSHGSINAAMHAVGAIKAGIDGVMTGAFKRAFCATRPPGHHAQAKMPMGFCLWNTAAIGAMYARHAYGLKRVAIVDFDVHHGNGSQELALSEPDIFYASIHQSGIYPQSGFEAETAFGNLVNVPLPSETDGQTWRAAFEEKILPALQAFEAEFVIVSAGFDGHRLDPLAGFNLEVDDYRWVTQRLLDAADGQLVSSLEGGYHLQALAACVSAHVHILQTYQSRGGENTGV
ncbi:acetoin utilization protein [Candidatus Phycosocius spiralis]|uniref:Acetoin utilization protein n=2 Tax=Candidatus Phycosocius spiralis TaxID=2815099 RepID=A0ABQ4PSF2_9PROT|nr:acetoin utilization protein [Candidatus Phycosocius spiralis]